MPDGPQPDLPDRSRRKGTHVAEQHRFSAPIEYSGNGAYVRVPFDVEREFGKKRVPVRATIDGIAYRGSLVRMGTECHVLGVLKSIRSSLGKSEGDVVDIVLEEDTEKRDVEIPADVQVALQASPVAARFFDGLAYSHKREYVRWIEEAKRDSTRSTRIARTIELLARGEKAR